MDEFEVTEANGMTIQELMDRAATCIKCGRCCRDTIIDDVYEADILREPRLLEVARECRGEPGRFILPTPCGFLRGNICGIYATRPDICVAALPGENWCCPLNHEGTKTRTAKTESRGTSYE